MAPGKGTGQHIPRAVLEALDSVVAPSVRDALLKAALDEYAEPELPSEPERLRIFAEGPLHRALVQGLGQELAETLTEEITRMLELAAPSSASPRRASRSSGKLRAVSTPPRRPSPPPRSLTPPSNPSSRHSSQPPRPLTPPGSPSRRRPSPRPATLRSLGARGLTPPPFSGEVAKNPPEFDEDDAPELVVSEVLAEVDFEDLPGLTESAPPADDPLQETSAARPLANLFPPPSSDKPTRDTRSSPRKLTLGSSSPGSRPAPSSRHPDDVKTPPWSSAEYPRTLAKSIGMAGAVPSSRPGEQRVLPHVLIASRDPAMLRRLAVWLDPRAAVMRVRSVIDLLHRIEDASQSRSVIVLDCRQPSVRPLALAALADELPASTRVVLVAAEPTLIQKLLDISPSTSNWLTLGSTARPKEIAARCAELVS